MIRELDQELARSGWNAVELDEMPAVATQTAGEREEEMLITASRLGHRKIVNG